MNAILSATLSYILLYKYIALFFIAYLASLFLPIPSDSALLAAGAFASQGYLNIYFVLAVSLAGNILGDLTGFVIARRYGKEFLVKIGLRKMIHSKIFTNLEKFIGNNPGPTIFITRFIGSLGPLVNILGGLSEMTFRKFFVYESTGACVDTLALGLAGYILGDEWQNMTVTIELVSAGLVIVILAFAANKIYFRKLFKE